MLAFRHHFFTEEEYLRREREAAFKSEYWQGAILAMAGGSFRHNRLCSRIHGVLSAALRGKPCQPSSGDQRLATPDRLYTYPDAAVYCGKIEARAGTSDVATNPTVLVEVLSDSTREYDRGEKLAMYKHVPSLQAVVFVEPDEVLVVVVSRVGDGWKEEVLSSLAQTLRLPAISAEVPLAELYAGVIGPEGPLPV